jgi:hypothetical protein
VIFCIGDSVACAAANVENPPRIRRAFGRRFGKQRKVGRGIHRRRLAHGQIREALDLAVVALPNLVDSHLRA